MTSDEQDALVERFAAALDSRRSIDEKTHAHHHTFINTLIEREQRNREMWDAVKTHLAKWGSVGLLSAVLLGLWMYVNQRGG